MPIPMRAQAEKKKAANPEELLRMNHLRNQGNIIELMKIHQGQNRANAIRFKAVALPEEEEPVFNRTGVLTISGDREIAYSSDKEEDISLIGLFAKVLAERELKDKNPTEDELLELEDEFYDLLFNVLPK